MRNARSDDWIIYDRSVRLIAMHAGTEDGIRSAYDAAPASIRRDLVVYGPGWKYDADGCVDGRVIDMETVREAGA